MKRKRHYLGKTSRTPLNHCLGCGHKIDAASPLDANARPSPGDTTICLHCRHVMTFRDDMTLRDLTTDEMIEVMKDHRVRLAQTAITLATKK